MAAPKLPLELAVFSPADALAAQTLGASRIELNAPGSYPSGGLTPPLAVLAALSPQLRIPMRVMIRPRGPPANPHPDFIYTSVELDAMRASIAEIKASGTMDVARGDGFVFGILRSDGDGALEIDEEKCAELVELARPVPCVFHRAFDPLPDCEAGVDVLVRCGFAGLLTAGGVKGGGCVGNLTRLDRICERAGGRIEVVAGGGVRHHNVNALTASALGGAERRGTWVHSAALKSDGSGMDEEEVQKLLTELAK